MTANENGHMRVARLPDGRQTVAQFWAEAEAIVERRKKLAEELKV